MLSKITSNLNIHLFNYINHFAGINHILDNLAIITAKYLFAVFILWLAYLWFKKKKEYKSITLYSTYSAILGLLFNFLISSLYFHPRPFMLHLGKLLIQHPPETSFPSDHTTFMLSIAFMLIYFRETRISGIILSIFGLIGGISRVYCGLHFPLDIIGSLAVALSSSLIIFSLKDKLKRLNRIIINLYNRIFGKKGKRM